VARGGGEGWHLNSLGSSAGDGGVTVDGIRRATAARATRVRPAPRMDRESAARRAWYGGMADAARGA
jgi:hypothetical protein